MTRPSPASDPPGPPDRHPPASLDAGTIRRGTLSYAQLSDVQIANLTLLLTIRDGVLQGRLSACSKFALVATQAERLGALTIQQIMAIVANLGDATLFPPRRDLVVLLELHCR